MTHPHQLHAQAAAASLRAALVSLGHRAAAERYGWAAADDGLRSPSWAPRRGSGGHADPVAEGVTGTVRSAGDKRARWTYATLAWLARRLLLLGEAPLDELELALPRLAPSTAWQVCLWLRDLDERVRADVGLGDGLRRFNAGACPACQASRWRAPGDFVVCRNELCLCAGEACACEMQVKAAGVQHIWAPEWPQKPERNQDGLDALRYAITGAAAVIRARRASKGE